MATTDVRPTAGAHFTPVTPATDQQMALRRGAVLLIGAIVLILIVKPVGTLPYFWIPAITGTVFLLAAAVAGKTSPLWGPGVAVSGWGWGWGHVISGYFTFGINTAAPVAASLPLSREPVRHGA